MGYFFATADISSLPPSSQVVKREHAGSEQLVYIPCRDVVWLPGRTYASMKGFCADWRTVKGRVATDDVPTEAKAPSVFVSDKDYLALLLEKNAGWAQDIGVVDPVLLRYGNGIDVGSLLLSCRFSVLFLRLLRSVTSICRLTLRLDPVLNRYLTSPVVSCPRHLACQVLWT